MAEVGSAFVSILPSAKGFGRKLDSQVSRDLDTSGKKSGTRFGAAIAVGAGAALGGAALGAAAFTKTAIGLEASFSKTMNVLQATTGASANSMRELSALAIKMGADTAFSASDASQAMLELARGGITPAQIQAGALKGTLTLAAAGELEMGEAANTAVKAMGQFNLAGKDMDTIAAALAGGANASSASVRDMSQALAQGGLAANSVGFSIQETTAVLAAFSNAGLEGSDAGTSMKTMLDRLQPTTEAAKTAMMQLGGWSSKTGSAFVKANGEFKSAAQVAEILHKGTEDLNAAERKRLITQAFGSDAQRAATIFAQEGAAGLGKLLKATSDTGAAQNMAAANMKGTAGAVEQLKGSLETLTLQFGLLIAPAVQGGLRLLTSLVNSIVPGIKALSSAISGGGGGGIGGAFATIGASVRANFLPVLRTIATTFQTVVLPAILRLGGYLRANLMPVFQQVGTIISTQVLPIVAALATFFYGRVVPAVYAIATAIGQRLKPVFDQLFATLQGTVLPILNRVLAKFREWGPTLGQVAMIVLRVVGFLLKMAASILGVVLPPLIRFQAFLIGNVVGALIAVVGGLIRAIGFVIRLGQTFNQGANQIDAFVRSVLSGIGNAIGAIGELPGRAAAALGDLGSTLYNAGASLIQGLLDGITDKIDDLQGVLSNVTGLIPDWKGPADKDAVLLRPAGQLIMGGLIGGIDSQRPNLRSKLRAVTGDISVRPSISAGAYAGGSAAAGAGPAVFKLYDVDGQLLGSMRGEIAGDRSYQRTLGRQGVVPL